MLFFSSLTVFTSPSSLVGSDSALVCFLVVQDSAPFAIVILFGRCTALLETLVTKT